MADVQQDRDKVVQEQQQAVPEPIAATGSGPVKSRVVIKGDRKRRLSFSGICR